ncbi:MAG: DUF4160 domain-containing protein [Gemmatimonadaceae bacterium]
MPTVLRARGFRVMIFEPPREHAPPHVHVFRGGAEAVIELSPVRVRTLFGMRDADAVAARRIVEDEREYLLRRWRQIHGDETIGRS